MSDNKQYNGPRPTPKVLSEFSLRLTGTLINGSRRPPSLGFNIKRDGKSGPWLVFLEARTNVEDDKDHGRITFGLDMPSVMSLLAEIQRASRMSVETRYDGFRMEIAARRFMRQQNSWSKEPMVDGIISLFQDDRGRLCIGISSWDNGRPKPEFPLMPINDGRRSVNFFNGRGEKLSDVHMSRIYAGGWAGALMALLSDRFAHEFTPPEPRPDQQGGGGYNGGNRQGGGGYNGGGNRQGGYNGGGGNGGYNANSHASAPAPSPASSGGWGDDDIPM